MRYNYFSHSIALWYLRRTLPIAIPVVFDLDSLQYDYHQLNWTTDRTIAFDSIDGIHLLFFLIPSLIAILPLPPYRAIECWNAWVEWIYQYSHPSQVHLFILECHIHCIWFYLDSPAFLSFSQDHSWIVSLACESTWLCN